MAKIKKWKKRNKVTDLLFLAGLFIGLGVGMIYNQVAVGVLIGMGCGFAGMFVATLMMKKK